MKFDKNLSSVHGYLCGNGYVIKNPPTQSKKYYQIGFRNFDQILLKDFQDRFFIYFKIKPIITKDGRCRIGNKRIYNLLTKDYSYYSYEWSLPKLSKSNSRYWLRSFFDCESWVENYPSKSRLIGLDCCNKLGLVSISKELLRFGIESSIRKLKDRTIWRLRICGKDNLIKFRDLIGFKHKNKFLKLNAAIDSYQVYTWSIPTKKNKLIKFIYIKGKLRESRKEFSLISVKKDNLINLQKALKNYKIVSRLLGPWRSFTCPAYYCLKVKEDEIYENGKNTRSSARNEKD